jgi:peptidylglycine monooxygenase
VLVFERDGSLAGSWGEGTLAEPHYVSRASGGAMLVADRDAHQVLRYDAEGHLLQALGKRHWPSLGAPFNHPTAAAQASDGEIYVADGYGNSHVHRFSADGRLIRTWGGAGSEPGRFSTPHAIVVDPRDRLLVGDRENNRVQVFDRAGGYLAEWGDFYHPMQIWIDERGLVFVSDQIPRISLLDLDGRLVGRCRGAINGAHGLSGDAEGNLYLAELPPQEITKLERLN